jgi:uncharacterized protein (DUF305 family)
MFNKQHFITVLSYIGIGFISGAISHWFFSGTRSLIMAALGILLFLVAEVLSEEKKNRWELIIFVILYSLAIWMVSGWLQHFLDSPMRSLWIVPVGYFVSLVVYQLKHPEYTKDTVRTLIAWAVTSLLLFVLLYTALFFVPQSWFAYDHHGQGVKGSSSMDHGEMIIDELSFIQLMIPHHQEAVDTTTELLKTTTDPQLQTLWNAIVEAQKNEIAMMQSWLQQRYPNPSIDHGKTYHLMMRSTEGITDSKQIDAIRTTDMIVHHEWAVQMAEKILILPDVREEVQTFAREVIRAQSTEIETMRSWLLGNKEVVMPHGMDINDHGH